MSHLAVCLPSDIEELERRLQQLHSSIGHSVLEAGAILCALKQKIGHGSWDVYLNQLCQRTGISSRAARYYMEAHRNIQEVGGHELVKAAQSAGLNLNKKPVRDNVIEIVRRSPGLSPTGIFKSAKIADLKKPKNPAIEQLAQLRKRFPTARIERAGGVLNGYEMAEFQVWLEEVTAAQAPKGNDEVTVRLTLNQLRRVKGKFAVGVNNLSATQAEKFLKRWR